MFEGLRSVGLITGLINTLMCRSSSETVFIVVLRLRAGEFLPARARCGFDSERASVFYSVSLLSRPVFLSLSVCPLGSRASGLDVL